MFGLNFFKKDDPPVNTTNANSWNPSSLTMDQPRSPAAPNDHQVVSEQPVCFCLLVSIFHFNLDLADCTLFQPAQEEMQLRGGGGGEVCCGVYVS